jgi:hypothetical protein
MGFWSWLFGRPRNTITLQLNDPTGLALKEIDSQPVQVIDPVSHRPYILLNWDLFERVRHILEEQESPSEPAVVQPLVREPASEGRPLRQYVRDLPMPPDLAAFARQWCRHRFWFSRKARQAEEDQLKLRYYYGGMLIAYLRTDRGPVVVAAANNLTDPEFDRQLACLTADERRQRLLDCPVPPIVE